MRLVAADAQQQGADTLITAGGLQSNHARVTAAAAAKLGMRAILVANGKRQRRPTGNALLDRPARRRGPLRGIARGARRRCNPLPTRCGSEADAPT
jgi:hypothetical protein